jgi:hypothetical protein
MDPRGDLFQKIRKNNGMRGMKDTTLIEQYDSRADKIVKIIK